MRKFFISLSMCLRIIIFLFTFGKAECFTEHAYVIYRSNWTHLISSIHNDTQIEGILVDIFIILNLKFFFHFVVTWGFFCTAPVDTCAKPGCDSNIIFIFIIIFLNLLLKRRPTLNHLQSRF